MAKPKNGNGKTASKRPLRTKLRDATGAFEEALRTKALKRAKFILRLYVTGSSGRSLRAVYNLKKLCEEYLPDDYDLEVIDIYKDPDAAREEQIIAAPTLVKKLPYRSESLLVTCPTRKKFWWAWIFMSERTMGRG